MKNKFSFNAVPQIHHARSVFHCPNRHLTSFNVGELCPVFCQEVLPGDSWKIDTTCLARSSNAFLKPVMDNLYMDVYFFFVPNRLVYTDWEKVFGDAEPDEYTSFVPAEVPTLAGGEIVEGTVSSYLYGLVGDCAAGATPLAQRGFALCWNEWFRNENISNSTRISKGAVSQYEVYNNDPWSETNYFGKLPKVAKYKDMFTACLPSPQKGDSVEIPVMGMKNAPVVGSSTEHGSNYPVKARIFEYGKVGVEPDNGTGITWDGDTTLHVTSNTPMVASHENKLWISNLVADNSRVSLNVDVNDFRFAVQFQKLLERGARGGTRYTEYLNSMFGVSSPDSRLQRPEFLGGKRIPLGVTQVTQTAPASGEGEAPLATLAGYSLTLGNSKVTKGFVEHGFIFGLACIRQRHTYQQGLSKQFTRKQEIDFYNPVFANIGEQPIYKTELYADAAESVEDSPIFGYNEAWVQYRTIPSKISGDMSSFASSSLDLWHYGDTYDSAPTLSQSFIQETPAFVDRTLSVTSSSQDQFMTDFFFDCHIARVMPTYSVPSLVDHN